MNQVIRRNFAYLRDDMPFRLPFLLILFALCSSGVVRAQHFDVDRLQSGPSSARLAFTFSWPSSLQAALDSAGVSSLDLNATLAVTGALFEVSESVEMPRLGTPSASIVESSFDEIRLEPVEDADSLLEELAAPLVQAGWAGVSAMKNLSTVRVRTLSYDSDTRVLRRFRRIVVEVQFPVGPTAGTSGSLLRAADNPHLSVTRSALADGSIVKIPVRTEGVYRLDAAWLNRALADFGMDVEDVDPSTIKMYGNGGKPLPARNDAPRPADLVENAVLVSGSGSNLSVVFYAEGPQGWTYNAGSDEWEHHAHPFSTDNFYFLKIDAGNGNGRRVTQSAPVDAADPVVLDQVTGRFLREYDDVMWSKDAGTGHTWVSSRIESFQQFDIFTATPLPGLTAGEVRYRARVAIRSNQSPRTRVFFQSNGSVLATATASQVYNTEGSPIAAPAEAAFLQNIGGSTLDLSMTIEDKPDAPQAAIDWIRVFYPQALTAGDGYLRFVTPPDLTGPVEFVLSGFSAPPSVWDVTDASVITSLPVSSSGTQHRVRVNASAGAPREIVAFSSQAYRAADAPTTVANQNLHGIAANPDFIIITPDTFRVYAEELADRRRQEGLVVEVADIQHVYNEFSGGLPDMRAVRDYFKFLYDRGRTSGELLRYALLFGDGHFNFRDIGQNPPELNNWIFPYETEESFDPVHSYTSDDYFGLLDDHEGVWPYVNQSGEMGERVDIGIGRFNVQSPGEARAILDKIAMYESAESLGPWRTRYTFVADDGHNGLAGTRETQPDLHTQNIDVIADQVLADRPSLNQKKIYGISYPRVFLTSWRQPEVRRDLLAAINSGSLFVNYSGHGGEDGLAQERIFTREDAAALTNREKLPIVITATCSFGRWDLSEDQSGAEVLMLNPDGGAVALLTTVRLVYTSSSTSNSTLNVGLNLALNRALMEPDDDGLPRRLGDVMRITKNTQAGLSTNNRKFNLLGDPTMRVGLPQPRIAIETVNGQSLASEPVQIRALDRVTIGGAVQRAAGVVDEAFDGSVHLTVFDARRQIPVEDASALQTGYYTVREDLIWRGEVQAQGGAFEATFVVPKDISYTNATGKISAYAQSGTVDADGFSENVVVGGSSSAPPNDNAGPAIALFMNDTTFVSGGLTNPVPELIVRLADESGINTVGAGVGHELLLVVDGDEQRAANIGEYYQSEENSYQRGTVRFPLDVYLREQSEERLSPGPHSVEVRAWDVLNNSASATLDFFVAQSEDLALRNVLNFPNPLSRDTRFIFEHNKAPGTPARIQIRIYTLAGRPVRTLDAVETLPAGVLPGGQVDVYWDGRDEDFDPVGTGIYLYKVRVEVDDGEEKEVVERIEKLAVIR